MYSCRITNRLNRSDENYDEAGVSMLDDRKITPVPLRVADAMTPDPITLSPHHTFTEVVRFMAQHPLRHFLGDGFSRYFNRSSGTNDGGARHRVPFGDG